MMYLTRSLMTKTGESPSTCNKLVRKLYGVLKPFDVDHPGHLQELVERVDRLERGHTTLWYAAQARKEVLLLRHELVTAQAPAPVLADTVAGVMAAWGKG